MRIDWLSKTGSSRVVCFFNGWGMDARVVEHLERDCDTLVVYDYRNLDEGDLSVLQNYSQVDVVAWSMGVWAAANVLPKWNIVPDKLVGLNGTERPVDNQYGIPLKVYLLTENGMNERGRKKFMARMFVNDEERIRFGENGFIRPLAEVCEELSLIRIQVDALKNSLKWDKIFISGNDVIFMPDLQKNWWHGKTGNIVELFAGHYPFYHFEKWEQILA